MKYTILINQFAAINSGLNLDLIDLAIFDFIKDFSNSAACVRMQTNEGIYFWISHKLVMEQMPLLNIKTSQGLVKRIDNLIQAGIISKHPNCDQYSRTLYCFGENYELLIFNKKESDVVTGVVPPQPEFRGAINDGMGGPPNESLGNNTNNVTNEENKNNAPANGFAASLFPEPEIEKVEKLEEKAIKKLFRNSNVFDKDVFLSKFIGPEYEKIDLLYYYNAVNDWSEAKQVKRTGRGWIATVNQFIRGDIEKKKLRLKIEFTANQKRVEMSGAMEYLNGDF